MVCTTLAAAITLTVTSASAAGPAPLPVTPYSGFNPSLTRAPYVTDLTQTSAYVTGPPPPVTGFDPGRPDGQGACPTSTSTWTSAATKVPTSCRARSTPSPGRRRAA